EEAGDLVGAEHTGEGAHLLAIGDHLDDVLAAQGDTVEEAEGAGGLGGGAPGGRLGQEGGLLTSGRAGGEQVGGAGGRGEGEGRGGAGCVVAQLQILSEALTQGRHGRAPGGERHPRSVGGSWPGECQPSSPRARANHPPPSSPTAQRFSSTRDWSALARPSPD